MQIVDHQTDVAFVRTWRFEPKHPRPFHKRTRGRIFHVAFVLAGCKCLKQSPRLLAKFCLLDVGKSNISHNNANQFLILTHRISHLLRFFLVGRVMAQNTDDGNFTFFQALHVFVGRIQEPLLQNFEMRVNLTPLSSITRSFHGCYKLMRLMISSAVARIAGTATEFPNCL